MRIFKLLALVAVPSLIAACDQRPIDLGPEQTGMEWRRVVEFNSDGLSSYDNPVVWGTGEALPYSDVYAWSRFTSPRLQHFNGSTWAPVLFQPNGDYSVDIWGSSPTDVYVTDGTVHHFDGTSWTDTGIRGGRISGSSASNVVVFSDSVLSQFDGVAWKTIRQFPSGYQIRDFSAYGANGVFIAARDSLLQWGNNQWKAFKAPGLADRVVAIDEGMCAVATFDANYTTSFWFFRNGVWTPLGADPVDGFIDDMCMGNGFVWIAHRGGLYRYVGPPAWVHESVPTHNDLFAISGTFYAVYSVGRGGVTVAWDTASSHLIRSSIPGDAYSIVATTPSDFLVGGDDGTVYHYLDGEWSEQPLADEGWRVTALARAGSHLFAGVSAGRVYQFDGETWALSADSLGQSSFGLSDLAAAPDGAAYAVGSGFISEFDGSAWRSTYSGTNHFQQVWAQSKSVAFATAYEGVFQFDGNSWKRVLQNKQDRYQGIWGTAADDVYVAAGSIYHFDGHAWVNVFPSNSIDLITGTGTDDVVASSQFGMARFDGRIWSWSSDRRSVQPIDIVPTRDAHVLRMYAEYRASDGDPKFVVSERTAP